MGSVCSKSKLHKINEENRYHQNLISYQVKIIEQSQNGWKIWEIIKEISICDSSPFLYFFYSISGDTIRVTCAIYDIDTYFKWRREVRDYRLQMEGITADNHDAFVNPIYFHGPKKDQKIIKGDNISFNTHWFCELEDLNGFSRLRCVERTAKMIPSNWCFVFPYLYIKDFYTALPLMQKCVEQTQKKNKKAIFYGWTIDIQNSEAHLRETFVEGKTALENFEYVRETQTQLIGKGMPTDVKEIEVWCCKEDAVSAIETFKDNTLSISVHVIDGGYAREGLFGSKE